MSQLLITEEYLKERSVIDDNVDFKKLVPIMEFVQDLSVKPLLGTKLYNLILTQSVEPGALSDDNKILMDDYVLKAMLLYIMAESPMVFKFRYQNKGIMVKSSENSQPADTADIYKLSDYWKNKAEQYGQAMQDFIRANPDKYPTFFTNSGINEKQPLQDAFDVDIYLPEFNKDRDLNDPVLRARLDH